MKTAAQLAFEAYRDALAASALHGNQLGTSHVQPWEALQPKEIAAWEAAAAAALKGNQRSL